MEKPKGLEKPQGLEKPRGLKKPSTGKLTPKKLESLGQLSLKEKMQQAAEQAETADSAALVLYESMSKSEKAKAWSKHQTALKRKSDEEREAHEALGKKEKGVAAAAYLLEKEGKQYMAALKKTSTSELYKQKDIWESECQILSKWTEAELKLHIKCGRIQWRECPGTWGVYEYKDTQNCERELHWKRQRELQQGSL